MFAIFIICLCFHFSTIDACARDADCNLFQVCVNNVCVANNQGCNPPCVAPMVCVAPNCVAVPAPQPQPATTTTAAPAATTTAAPAATTTTARRTCPPSWSLFNNNCYIASVAGRFLFNQASDWCTQTGSRVVWFDQSNAANFNSELAFVNNLAISGGSSRYWIGVNRQFGQWVWTNGSPVILSNWRPSQPDGCCGSNVTCVFVNYANFLGQWDDASCGGLFTNPQGFVCKRPL
uniref:C-type lectin-2 n=1 Tax=Toxocara canis TaxID=6265 RepID=A0A0M4MTM6_TOXCA|nr:C-type lectin-2 [Toxocara canis]